MDFNKVSIKKNFGKIFKYPYLKLRNKNKITIFVFHDESIIQEKCCCVLSAKLNYLFHGYYFLVHMKQIKQLLQS